MFPFSCSHKCMKSESSCTTRAVSSVILKTCALSAFSWFALRSRMCMKQTLPGTQPPGDVLEKSRGFPINKPGALSVVQDTGAVRELHVGSRGDVELGADFFQVAREAIERPGRVCRREVLVFCDLVRKEGFPIHLWLFQLRCRSRTLRGLVLDIGGRGWRTMFCVKPHQQRFPLR